MTGIRIGQAKPKSGAVVVAAVLTREDPEDEEEEEEQDKEQDEDEDYENEDEGYSE
jgi:hypothetical protein